MVLIQSDQWFSTEVILSAKKSLAKSEDILEHHKLRRLCYYSVVGKGHCPA